MGHRLASQPSAQLITFGWHVPALQICDAHSGLDEHAAPSGLPPSNPPSHKPSTHALDLHSEELAHVAPAGLPHVPFWHTWAMHWSADWQVLPPGRPPAPSSQIPCTHTPDAHCPLL